MKTIEEKREYDRVRKAKWYQNNPEARERNRVKNAKWRAKHREEYNRNMNEWRANNTDKVVRYKLKERYNITPERYNEMLRIQNNRCLICGNEESAKHNHTQKVQKLAVDHCHSTGKVRGLLCQDCNRGIGKFHEDPVRLANAIKYLQQFSVS